jgi:hypothetical protein
MVSLKIYNKMTNRNICYEKSFASHKQAKCWHPTKNDIKARDVLLNSHKKICFICADCNHDFFVRLYSVNTGNWCPYCSNKKLCECNGCDICLKKSFALHEKARCWHSTKNDKEPRDVFLNSVKKCWFTCADCKHDFSARLYSVNTGSWCPICINKTEKKLLKFLEDNYPNNVIFQAKYDWCKNPDTNRLLPFDFEVCGSIIIELDGPQHIDKQISNWKSPEDHQERDIYKMDQAINNEKHVVRILQEDVYNDKNNWEDKLLEEIRLLRYDTDTKIKCIGNCNLYKQYIII